MRVVRRDDVFVIQFQRADEGGAQFGQEVQRAAEERHVPPNRLATGQPADGLVDDGLENGGGQVLPGGPVINQGLYVGFGKDAAARGDGVEGVIIFGIPVKARSVRLEQGSHLVDKGARAPGADPVHPLFHVSALEINNLGILAAKFDGDVGLRRIRLQGARHGDDFLHEGHVQVVCQGKPARAGDDRGGPGVAEFAYRFPELLDVCKMPLVVGEQHMVIGVQDGNLDRRGADVNP